VNEWQANRDASRTQAQEHDDALRRHLEREPPAGPPPFWATAPAPRYETEPLPSHPRPRINQWPVVKSIAIIIIAAVVLSALQLHGELGDAREFLKEDLSKGIPSFRVCPVSSEFSLNRIMTTTCRGGEITYSVDVAIPQSIFGQQEIVELQQSPSPTRTSGEYWNWSGTIFTGQSISIAINYHSKSYYYQWELGPGESGTTAQKKKPSSAAAAALSRARRRPPARPASEQAEMGMAAERK
jgi:hypothetical protein